MYWSVHQYHRPMIGAQKGMPSQGKLPLKYQACLTTCRRRSFSTGAQVPSTPGGISGFQRLNMSEPQICAQLAPAAQLDQPVDRQQGRADDEDDGLHGVVVGHGPHAAQHRVQAGQHDHQHRADPEAVDHRIPADSRVAPPAAACANTTPPAKMPTAIFDTTNVISDTIEST